MIVLNPAYVWDCDSCGRENFCRGLIPEFSAEELENLKSEHGVQPWETGDFMVMPEEVECAHCHSTFKTEHYKAA